MSARPLVRKILFILFSHLLPVVIIVVHLAIRTDHDVMLFTSIICSIPNFHICCPVLLWSEFLVANPRVPSSIPSYQIFCVAVDLERGPLSLVRINKELLEI
jgi:hypothetical protein